LLTGNDNAKTIRGSLLGSNEAAAIVRYPTLATKRHKKHKGNFRSLRAFCL
jgi:hypothetical protein